MNLADYIYAADVIDRFIEGKSKPREWDDFISIKSSDRFLDAIRIACSYTRDIFRPSLEGEYTSDAGKDVLRDLSKALRSAVLHNST